MLVLSRKANQVIVIDDHIIVKVLRIADGVVSLGIQAPSSVPIHRQEIYDAIQSRDACAEKGSPPDGARVPEEES